ncbi:MAG TPA: ANTAR domain-containing protein [Isosphaeraceae bacterium]|nr:ANTAR domain-containing protein [Isosphaeraceae bacterium]
MTPALRIAVADDEPRMLDYYQDTLPLLGHRVTCAAPTGQDLVRCCRDARPDLVITDIKMPDMDGIDAIVELDREEPIPAILVSAYHDPELFERTKEGHVLAYLVKPIKQADLEAAITIAMQRFEQFRALRQEAGALRQALEDRKLIERAKGVLMRRAGLDEEEAFLRLQKLARDLGQKMVEVARMILRAEPAFQPPKTDRAKSQSTDAT